MSWVLIIRTFILLLNLNVSRAVDISDRQVNVVWRWCSTLFTGHSICTLKTKRESSITNHDASSIPARTVGQLFSQALLIASRHCVTQSKSRQCTKQITLRLWKQVTWSGPEGHSSRGRREFKMFSLIGAACAGCEAINATKQEIIWEAWVWTLDASNTGNEHTMRKACILRLLTQTAGDIFAGYNSMECLTSEEACCVVLLSLLECKRQRKRHDFGFCRQENPDIYTSLANWLSITSVYKYRYLVLGSDLLSSLSDQPSEHDMKRILSSRVARNAICVESGLLTRNSGTHFYYGTQSKVPACRWYTPSGIVLLLLVYLLVPI